MDVTDGEHNNKRLRVVIAAVASSVISSDMGNKFTVIGKLGNRTDADYNGTVKKIMKLKQSQPLLFTRIYRLSTTAHVTENHGRSFAVRIGCGGLR